MGCREFRCEAISHLEEISPDGIDAMAETGSVAVILPTTAYILRLRPPPVREMIDRGVIVALGTDFNPNAFCLTMVMIVSVYAAEILLKKYSWETNFLFSTIFRYIEFACVFDEIWMMFSIICRKFRDTCVFCQKIAKVRYKRRV